MTQLQVWAERTIQAAPETIWALVSDAMMYPEWGPWRKAGYRQEGESSRHGVGAEYWLESSRRYGLRRPVSVEKVIDFEDGRRLAYTVIGGIPVRNYRAEITLTPGAGGTQVRWEANWDRTLSGRVVHRSLREAYPQIMADLAAAAEAHAGLPVHDEPISDSRRSEV
jgi:uncharacterized protein YndB with AHSA1/START domain